MSNVNDNNLDDLLRRAAEKYPLRTDSADFGKLVADLEKDPSLILPPLNTEDRRRRRRFFWLFLLLPLGGGAYFAWHATVGRAHTAEIAGEKQITVPKVTKGEETASGVVKKEEPASGVTKSEGMTPAAGKRAKEKADVVAGKTAIDNNGGGKVAVSGERARHNRNGQPTKEQTFGNEIEAANTSIGQPVKGQTAGNRSGLVDDGGARTGLTGSTRKVDGKLSLVATKGAFNVNIPVKAGMAAQANDQQKNKVKLQKPKPSFYAGIVGSPDLSMIRMQSVKSVGYNFGLLFGYSFNSRWAIETGLYYDRKKYYTDGEYFSKSKLPSWFSNYNFKTVDGFCDMWEIPLNVRYNFSRGDKMKWFATAGLSTYLMSKEVYTFKGTNASGNPWDGTWPYKTPYKYWFSILNLSVGYEQRLGKIGNLRLEPFLRVPLSGIGTGSLSIMSAGLNIGITRRIW